MTYQEQLHRDWLAQLVLARCRRNPAKLAAFVAETLARMGL